MSVKISAFGALSLLALASPLQAQNTVITGARMLDVTGKMVEHPAVFVDESGRITNIADARTVKWGSDVTHIDLGDRTLLPGLIDMLVHLDGPADIGGYRGLEFTDSFWGMTAVGAAKSMLDAGFTTVRNVGSGDRNDIGLKQAIDNGYGWVRWRRTSRGRPAHRACKLCAGGNRRALRFHLPSPQP